MAFHRFSQKKEDISRAEKWTDARDFWPRYATDIVLEMEKSEMKMQKRLTLKAGIATAALALAGSALAQQKTVTFANQDMLVPLRLVMESGEVEKETGYKINWRMFSGGGDVIRAMASGDVQMGELGSSPLTAAASQGQDIKLLWISADIASAEALVARDGGGISNFKSMEGKRIGVPFVSTAHYQLIAALGKEGVDARKVNIMNMRPPEIAAAWERGDIDGTFVWDPVLAKVKQKGKVIATSGSIAQMGYPTFEGIAVSSKFAQENPQFMVAFIKALNRASAQVRDNLATWTPDSPEIKAIAKWSKADPKDVPAAMALYRFPSAEEQLGAQWLEGGAAKAIKPMQQFIASFPNSVYIPNAYYWLGEFYLASNPADFVKAKKSFNEVVNKYPKSAKASTALYRVATITQEIDKRTSEATVLMKKLLRDYPGAAEAQYARTFIAAHS